MSRSDAELRVFFDGGCPLCRREIAFYDRRAGAERIEWIDVTTCPEDRLPAGATRDRLLKRFHIQTADGDLLSGAPAFVAIWERLVMFRALAVLARLPGAMAVLEWAYRRFLRFRPRLQRRFAG